MRRLTSTLLFLPLLAWLAPNPAVAQSEESPTPPSDQLRVYEMYFKVDVTDLPAWVEFHQTHEAPVLKTLVEERILGGYQVWLHDTGGEYNVRYNLLTPNWDAIGDFVDAYYSRMDPAALEGAMSMVREHVDQIWVVGGRGFPPGWAEETSLVYEAAFQLDFAAGSQWNDDFVQYTRPALERAVEEGVIKAWVALGHDTGGPHNAKYLYYLEDWDQVDDALAFLNEVRVELGMTAESMAGLRGHTDEVWRLLPRQ